MSSVPRTTERNGSPETRETKPTSRIDVLDLPNELRALGENMERVGAAIRYYGGFGPFAEWGDMLETQSAPMCRELAGALERMRGGNA
jgi:hypothetical protein